MTVTHLIYIEILHPQGKFRCLIPASFFKREEILNSDFLDRFIDSLAEGNIYPEVESEAETDFVKTSEGLIAILPKIRESKHGWLPVLSKDRRLEGVVTKEVIESRIADEVISVQEWLTGMTFQRERLIGGFIEGINGDPGHKCKGRSAAGRLARMIAIADEAGLDLHRIREIQSQVQR